VINDGIYMIVFVKTSVIRFIIAAEEFPGERNSCLFPICSIYRPESESLIPFYNDLNIYLVLLLKERKPKQKSKIKTYLYRYTNYTYKLYLY
jgi:hypothetical protein